MKSNRGESGKGLFDGDASASAPQVQLRLDDEEVSITLRRAWDRALRLLAQRVNKPTFETHLRGLKPMSFTEETDERGNVVRQVTIGAPSPFIRSWVEGRHALLIREVLEEIWDSTVHVSFSILPKDDGNSGLFAAAPSPTPGPSAPVKAAAPALDFGRDDLAPTTVSQRRAETNVARSGVPSASSRSQARYDPARTVNNTVPHDNSTTPGRPVETPYSVPAEPKRTERPNIAAASPAVLHVQAPPASSSTTRHPDAPEINPRYTFDRFVVGPTNRLAHGGAAAVAENLAERFNPLFLYGNPGLGKTHLMHAIANAHIAKAGPNKPRIAYMSGEAFTSQFITSLRQKKAEDFRRRMKSIDLWLVDDIQFIAGKEQTKEEFFHTFNMLQSAGKQIVICSDRSPRELRTMDERLQSRFESGLVADIAPPDLETRLAILQKKAENESTRVPDDVLLYMARLVQSNIRTLEGALVKLVAYASLVNSPVTTQMAEGILEKYFIAAGAGNISGDGPTTFPPASARFAATAAPGSDRASFPPTGEMPIASSPATASVPAAPTGKLTQEMIRRVVARKFNVDLDDLAGKRRDRDAVNARQVAMHLLRELTDISLPGIGQLFGGRDHTTVIHACDRIKAQMGMDDELKSMVEGILAEMGATGKMRKDEPPQRHVGQTFENSIL